MRRYEAIPGGPLIFVPLLSEKHLENQERIRGQREAVVTINKLTDQMLLADGKPAAEPDFKSPIVPEVVDDIPEEYQPEFTSIFHSIFRNLS